MPWLLNRWTIGVFIVLVILTGTYFKGYFKGKASVQSEWDKAVVEQTLKSIEIERSMQQKIDSVVEEKNNEIARVKRNHASLVARLQQRPERPVSANPTTAQSCSGAELYREDGSFLAGEAARADQYAIELLSCYKAYDEVFNATKNNR